MDEPDTREWHTLKGLGCDKIRSFSGGIYAGSAEFHIWIAYAVSGQVQVIPIPLNDLPDIAQFGKEEQIRFKEMVEIWRGKRPRKGGDAK